MFDRPSTLPAPIRRAIVAEPPSFFQDAEEGGGLRRAGPRGSVGISEGRRDPNARPAPTREPLSHGQPRLDPRPRSRPRQGVLATPAAVVHQLHDRLRRSLERGDRQADDGSRPSGLRQRGLRVRRRGVLLRLFPAGDPRHPDRRALERPQVDLPDHDLVGDHGRPDGPGPRALALLHDPIHARPGRGRLLSRRDRLPDALVPVPGPGQGARLLLRGHADRPVHQPQALEPILLQIGTDETINGVAGPPSRGLGTGGLAVGLHRLGHPGGDPRGSSCSSS